MTRTVLAWASFVIGLVVSSAAALLLPTDAFFVVLIAPFGAVGAILASRRPEHRIGWIFCSFAVTFAVYAFANAYATAGLAAGSEWPAARFAAWLDAWFWLVYVTQLELAFLLFPTGRLAGPRWRWLARAIISANAILAVARAFVPGPLEAHPIDNPFGLAALAPAMGLLAALLPVFLLGALLSLGSPLARLPGTGGVEREQIKWFGSAGVLLVLELLLGGVLRPIGLDPAIADFVSNGLYAVGVVGVPVAMVVAILRYRLYDIDVLIRRTLIYAAVSAVLLATYIGGVALFQFVLAPITSGSGVAVAISTLAAGALFQPVRRRIQSAVDRRFYRSRYDAVRTLDAFAVRLRDEVDLEALRAELLDVVGQTIQPAHASLWLRSAR
jgi:hypothetical protein